MPSALPIRSLWFRFIGAFAAVIAVTLIVMILVVNLAAARQLDVYVTRSGQGIARQLIPLLAESYVQNGDWRGAQAILTNPLPAPEHDYTGGRPGPGKGQGGPPGGMGDPMMWQELGFDIILTDMRGIVAADTSSALISDALPRRLIAQGTPITANGRRIGTLMIVRNEEDSPARLAFLGGVQRAAILAGLAAGVVALGIGTLLFRRITQPLKSLQGAAHQIAGGDLGARVPVTTDDEIGEVGHAFNRMAENLSQQMGLRRQMVADIAHELRNPIGVMQGTLEAMQDGLLQPTHEELGDLHSDVRRLARLVEDLRTLSLADAGQLALVRDSVDVSKLAEYVAGRMAPRAAERGVDLRVEAAAAVPGVNADEDRLAQVIGNLLDNALRHTPSGGSVTVRTRGENNHVLVEVADTGPGIAERDQPNVFERFWRGDRSRSRESGGSGLGLAIVRQLVEMQGGSVSVASTPGQGATFLVSLPAQRDQR